MLALIRNLPLGSITQMQDLLGVRNSHESLPPLAPYGSEEPGVFFDQFLAEYADDSLKAELSSRTWKEVEKAPISSITPEGDRPKSKIAPLC